MSATKHKNCFQDEVCNAPSTYKKQTLYFVKPFKEKNEIICRLRMFSKELKWLCKQSEARKIFLLICINLAGTVLLLIWCRLTSSLALLSFTYLSWFNFLSLLTSLLCVWVENQIASLSYTFGLMQSEILAVFSSITLTLVGALFILKESIERFIKPEPIQLDKVSTVAFIGFILNVAITTFARNPPLSHILRASPSSLLQEHFADMCHSLCFHIPWLHHLLLPRVNPLILVTMTGFVFIVGDQIVVQVYNYPRGDTVAAICIALFTITTMYPMCICSAKLLLQTIPLPLSAHLDKCLREALTIDGVLEFHNENFWVLGVGIRTNKVFNPIHGGDMTGSIVAGSLHVRVRRDANEQLVLNAVRNILKPVVPVLTVQVFKDDWKRSTTTLQLLNDSALSFARLPFQQRTVEKVQCSGNPLNNSTFKQNKYPNYPLQLYRPVDANNSNFINMKNRLEPFSNELYLKDRQNSALEISAVTKNFESLQYKANSQSSDKYLVGCLKV